MGLYNPEDSLISESEEYLIKRLLSAMSHSNANVRAGAALALGRLKSIQAAEVLLIALEDRVHFVRQTAARALGMLGAPVVGLLLAQIQENTNPDLQNWLSESLGHIRDPDAADVLSTALNYLGPPAQYGAADALGAIGDPRSIPALIQTSQSADPMAKQRAAVALLQIGDPQAINALSVLLAESDPRLRQIAVRGLGRLGGEQSLLTLLTRLNDPEEIVRQETAAAIGTICEPGLEEILLTALNNSSSWVQNTIAHALGNCPGVFVKQRLLDLMNEQGDLQTRLTAAQSLARLGDERGKAMILRTLNAPNMETRRLAAIALGWTRDERAVVPLIEALRLRAIDPSTSQGRRLRLRLFHAMREVGKEMVDPLIEVLAENDSAIRRLAADALHHVGSPAYDALGLALDTHPNKQVRLQAAQILGRSGDPDTVEPLLRTVRETLLGPYPIVFFLRLLFDSTEKLRAAAAVAIGEIETQDGAALLLSSARFDPSPVVNAAAEAALARSGSPAIIVRFADIDVSGFVNRALAAAIALLITGFIAGYVSSLFGVPDATVLVGLFAGAALGVADGLEGRRNPIRGAILGGLISVGFAWLASFSTMPAWFSSLIAVVFPFAGAVTGWGRATGTQRLVGLFGGIVLGFLAGAAAGILLGTIG